MPIGVPSDPGGFRGKAVIASKRSVAAGYGGLGNERFYVDKTKLVFGDAKEVIEEMGKAIE